MRPHLKSNKKFPVLANSKKVLKKTTRAPSGPGLVVNALFAFLADSSIPPCTLLYNVFLLDWVKEDW